jgi:hypothetical protein
VPGGHPPGPVEWGIDDPEEAMSLKHAFENDPPIRPDEDPVETVVPVIPIVLPMVGAALIFLLAFIAIYMA